MNLKIYIFGWMEEALYLVEPCKVLQQQHHRCLISSATAPGCHQHFKSHLGLSEWPCRMSNSFFAHRRNSACRGDKSERGRKGLSEKWYVWKEIFPLKVSPRVKTQLNRKKLRMIYFGELIITLYYPNSIFTYLTNQISLIIKV